MTSWIRDLPVVRRLDAHQAGEPVGGVRGQPHERRGHVHEAANGTGNRLRNGLGLREGDTLRDELADDRREERHGEGDDHDRERAGDTGGHAEGAEPSGEGLREARGGERRGSEAHERDGELYGGQELTRIGRELQGIARLAVALLRLGFEDGALGVHDRHLRRREESVHEREQKGDYDAYGYVHALLRDLLGPMVRYGSD